MLIDSISRRETCREAVSLPSTLPSGIAFWGLRLHGGFLGPDKTSAGGLPWWSGSPQWIPHWSKWMVYGKSKWAVLKTPFLFHEILRFIGIPNYWMIIIPNILHSIIPYYHQPTGVLNTAHMDNIGWLVNATVMVYWARIMMGYDTQQETQCKTVMSSN